MHHQVTVKSISVGDVRPNNHASTDPPAPQPVAKAAPKLADVRQDQAGPGGKRLTGNGGLGVRCPPPEARLNYLIT